MDETKPNNGDHPLGQDQIGASKEETKVSVLILVFNAPGAAEFRMQVEGIVTPAQLLTAAGWLKWKAESTFEMAEIASASQRLQVARTVPKMPLGKLH